jgi:regulator of sigma D
MTDYKYKALKYKKKYQTLMDKLKLIGYNITNSSDTQEGGFDHDQYLLYENELKQIYNNVSANFSEDDDEYVVLTGSGALAYILFKLGMNEELESMNEPNDLDIVYYTKKKLNSFTKQAIGDYVVEPGKQNLDSRTFILKPELQSEKKIKQFDLTKMKEKKPELIEINDRVDGKAIKINILNLKNLKYLYLDSEFGEDDEKIKSRVALIDKIITHIKNTHNSDLIHEYKLDQDVTKRTSKSEGFDSERFDSERFDSDGEFVIKGSLFDSDEEE